MEAEKNLEELIDDFCNVNKIHHFEGDRGVANLEKIVTTLGYKGHGFKYGDPIQEFLADNPGVIEAILTWIKETDNDDWKEGFLPPEDN